MSEEQNRSSVAMPCGGQSCAEQAGRAIEVLRNRWSVAILEQLVFSAMPVRFGELQRRLGTISQRELSRQLQLLAIRGVVTRTIRSAKPLNVDYEITSSGRALLRHIEGLSEWANARGER